jgi:hypothetical protein
MFPSTTTLPTNLSIPDKVRDGPQEGGLSVSALPVSAGKNTDPGCKFEILFIEKIATLKTSEIFVLCKISQRLSELPQSLDSSNSFDREPDPKY